MSNISIIIPVYNEEQTILQLIRHLNTHSITKAVLEIIIVDGGSSDNTQHILKSQLTSKQPPDSKLQFTDKLVLLNAPKGRAKQMNAGAKVARGTILYFLHADSFPPLGFDESILISLKKNHFAGCFKMQFDHNHWWLQLAGWLTQFNYRACRGGDQSLFVSKQIFTNLGGFDEQFVIYEDINFINKLYDKYNFTVLKKASITTSARRYKTNGIWKLQYHFWIIYIKKWFGASAKDLQAYYFKHIH
ncbi:MAG: glycosyltransferase family 2 protein [Flavobacteriaceae bacterium]|nr:glycosyltransferase family 2 protein [Flavobacteriaceae bacterium]